MIARQYVTGFAEFSTAVSALQSCASTAARAACGRRFCLYVFPVGFPDSHVARKHGNRNRGRVQEEATPCTHARRRRRRGSAQKTASCFRCQSQGRDINPGTSADLTVASLLSIAPWLPCIMGGKCLNFPSGFLPLLSGQPAPAIRVLRTRIAVHRASVSRYGVFGQTINVSWRKLAVAKINKVMVGESLVGDGNEVAHIDLLIGPRGSAVETAFCNALTNNKDGFTSLLAVIAPNLAVQAEHDDVQQGHDQGRQTGRPDVRTCAASPWQRPFRTVLPMAPFRRTRLTICSSASASSSIGKPKTTPRSRTSTTTQPRKPSSAQ